MYATLPLGRLLAILVWPFALIFAGFLVGGGIPADIKQWVRLVGTSVSVWALTLIILGGSAERWSPWRVIWRIAPTLNDLAFPDLNGNWEGTTSSNWPIVLRMKDAATGPGGLLMEELPAAELQKNAIKLRVRASLFRLSLMAELESTGGKSHSVMARVIKDEVRDEFDLSYIYRQNTPEAGLLDEASHLGAAVLSFERSNWRLCGEYWTKRSWRMGLNTAGLIDVRRVSR